MKKILNSPSCSVAIVFLLREIFRFLQDNNWITDSISKYISEFVGLFCFVYVVDEIRVKIIEWNEKRGVKTQDNH